MEKAELQEQLKKEYEEAKRRKEEEIKYGWKICGFSKQLESQTFCHVNFLCPSRAAGVFVSFNS